MKKRYVIEFTVEAEDFSDEWIKDQALQELTCMSPFPEDIDFHRKDNPWHTGEPTEDGWYLLECQIGNFKFYVTDHWNNEVGFWTVNRVIRWQKIEE